MGRPAFEPTPEQRDEVARLRQAKVSIQEIARRLTVTPKTLRKAFPDELGLSPAKSVNTQSEGQEILPPPPREPAFVPNLEQRQRVTILAGARISPEEIARKMEMTVDMLKEHFADELANGPAICKSDILESTFYAGKGGNVAAQKVFLAFNSQADAEDEKAKPLPAEGKKQQRLANAETAGVGSEWGSDLETPPTGARH